VFEPNKEAKDFPAEGLVSNGCQYCDFCNACNAVEMARFPSKARKTEELAPEVQEELRTLTISVAGLRKQIKEIEKEKKEKEAALKDALFLNETTRAAGDGWSTSVSKNNGRKSTDLDRLVADTGVDLEDYQTTGNSYFVLRAKSDGDSE
jgi:hypothetical protein